jgi:DNA-binding LacI/PurR family transcriptional regulator
MSSGELIPRRPTIVDVAQHAGVSIATVSRVLADKKGKVSDAVRQNVLASVRALGYRPNRQARTFRTKRTQLIGLTISDIENPFYTGIVRAVEDVAYAHKFSLLLCNTDEDLSKERFYLEFMCEERVAGVIASPTSESETTLQPLIDAGIPVVAIDRQSRLTPVDCFMVDNIASARMLTQHVLDRGHNAVGAILGTSRMTSGAQRKQGFLSTMTAAGLAVQHDWLREVMPSEVNGYEAMRALLAQEQRPSAIFTGNNLITMGALRALREANLHVPEEMSIVGQDDLPWMALLDVGLTVSAQPVHEMGRLATLQLIARINGDSGPPREVALPPELIVRNSCAPPSHGARTKEVMPG